MDPIIGSLMLFSGILIMFFGIPIAGAFILTQFLGSPQIKTVPVLPTVMPLAPSIEVPIPVKKNIS